MHALNRSKRETFRSSIGEGGLLQFDTKAFITIIILHSMQSFGRTRKLNLHVAKTEKIGAKFVLYFLLCIEK